MSAWAGVCAPYARVRTAPCPCLRVHSRTHTPVHACTCRTTPSLRAQGERGVQACGALRRRRTHLAGPRAASAPGSAPASPASPGSPTSRGSPATAAGAGARHTRHRRTGRPAGPAPTAAAASAPPARQRVWVPGREGRALASVTGQGRRYWGVRGRTAGAEVPASEQAAVAACPAGSGRRGHRAALRHRRGLRFSRGRRHGSSLNAP